VRFARRDPRGQAEDLMAVHPIVESRPYGGDSSITLTTIGSRDVKVRVEASPMRGAGPGDKTVWLDLHDGPLAVTFTTGEAVWLAGHLSERGRTRPAAAEAVAERRAVVGAVGLIEQFDREIRDRQAEDSERRSGSRRAALTASVNPADLGRMTTFKHIAGAAGRALDELGGTAEEVLRA
jgi:hypothetical protein